METERTRYINIRFISTNLINEKDAWFIVSFEVKRLFGVMGAADAGLFLSHFEEEKQGAIFRCAHRYVHKVRAAICFINTRHNKPLYLYAENVSGTLKKAREQLTNQRTITRYEQLQATLTDYWKTTFRDDHRQNRYA